MATVWVLTITEVWNDDQEVRDLPQIRIFGHKDDGIRWMERKSKYKPRDGSDGWIADGEMPQRRFDDYSNLVARLKEYTVQ